MTELQIELFIMILTNIAMIFGGYLLGQISEERKLIKVFAHGLIQAKFGMFKPVKMKKTDTLITIKRRKRHAKSTR